MARPPSATCRVAGVTRTATPEAVRESVPVHLPACHLKAAQRAPYARGAECEGELAHHGDRGSQHVPIRYGERLAEAGIEPSVGSTGDSDDNALAYTINGPHEAAIIHRRGPWKTREAVELTTLEGGSRGSSAIACSSPSATSCRPKPRQTTGARKFRPRPQASLPTRLHCRALNHEHMAQPGTPPTAPAGGWKRGRPNSQGSQTMSV